MGEQFAQQADFARRVRTGAPERIQWLEQHTGMSYDELLAGLGKELPKTVDQLTPNGSVPKEADASRVTA